MAAMFRVLHREKSVCRTTYHTTLLKASGYVGGIIGKGKRKKMWERVRGGGRYIWRTTEGETLEIVCDDTPELGV